MTRIVSGRPEGAGGRGGGREKLRINGGTASWEEANPRLAPHVASDKLEPHVETIGNKQQGGGGGGREEIRRLNSAWRGEREY
jgi:hypothetical protein